MQRGGGSDLDLARLKADDPDALTADARAAALLDPALKAQYMTMATEALVALYRLKDFYPLERPPGRLPRRSLDGEYLLRVTQDLLRGWDTAAVPAPIRLGHKEMFEWFATPLPEPKSPQPDPRFEAEEVQAGILSGYGDPGRPIMHGCLLMFSVTDAEAARRFIAARLGQISWEGDRVPSPGCSAFVNVAVTHRGLANLWVPADEIAKFPKEFRDGLEERAGLIGDNHENHPRRWPLPERFLYSASTTNKVCPRVDLGEVDLVIQLRTSDGSPNFIDLPNTESGLRKPQPQPHPLAAPILDMLASATAEKMTLLCVQPMRRLPVTAGGEPGGTREHFGIADCVSQPTVTPAPGTAPRDLVKRGELLLGYGNDRGDAPQASDFLKNGSFLVVRKMRQNVASLNDFLANPPGAGPKVTGDALLAKMVGRKRNGDPLAGAGLGSDFDYGSDLTGDKCPLPAHIRRANPRAASFRRPTPRIMRRGMSYGPTYDENPNSDDRGIVFMAYNASIAEQYEVVQRWINGGNSTGVAAAQNDPLVGARPMSGPNTFRFIERGSVVRVDIPTAPDRAFVNLEWGLYLFAPSKATLATLADSATMRRPALGSVDRGEAIINALSALRADEAAKAWKVLLEDFAAKDPAEHADTLDVFAAIRELRSHGGILRMPQGLLVASHALVEQVFVDTAGNYTVSGWNKRLKDSIGEIFLGQDPGPKYNAQSTVTNNAIMAVREKPAFDKAHECATLVLAGILNASAATGGLYPVEIDLRRDFITPALALICRFWFGLPYIDHVSPSLAAGVAPPNVVAGDWEETSAANRTPRCPGDFMAPSRHAFYPDPTEAIEDYGKDHGKALHDAVEQYFDRLRPTQTARHGDPEPDGEIAKKMFWDTNLDNKLLASTLVGIMVGALPPLDGNLRFILYEWIKEKTLWRHQRALLGGPAGVFNWAKQNLDEPVKRAMQKRPAPDLLWRTAAKTHSLGELTVNKDDIVFISVASATIEKQNAGDIDVFPVFGGDRRPPPPNAPPQPRAHHACPAYEMAMGTMLGMLTALLEAGRIEELPAPLIVRLSP